MESLQGKHFSITEPKNVNTVIYEVNETTKNEVLSGAPRYTIERLPFAEELRDNASRKTFFVDNPKEQGNQLVILSFSSNRVMVNLGILQDDKVKISKKPMPVKFDTLYSEEKPMYKEFKYTPNLQRPISIIDPVTTEEIKPTLYFDKETNEVKGKCMLEPNKPYFAFEIRDNKKNKKF